MELCKEYKTLSSSLQRDTVRESFELDFQESLPQYLDDIQKIVRCSVKNVAVDYECGATEIKIFGKTIISITYLNENNCILSNIFEEDFTKSFALNEDNVNFAQINLITKYSNFHLINQRRIDIHTSVKAEIPVFSQCNEKCLTNCKNAFVKEYNPTRLKEKCCGIISEEFDETFAISASSAQIKNIINTFSHCCVEETKIIKDKMLVKAKITFSILFENSADAVEKSVHSFSLSKIIEISDADENDKAFVNASVSGIYVKTKANSDNKLCDIEIVGRIAFDYRLFAICDDEYIVDSYIPKFETDIERKELEIKSSPLYYNENKTCEIALDCDRNIIEIVDLKAEAAYCSVENSLMTVGFNISFLYYDDASQLFYFEKTSDYKFTVNDNQLSGTGSVSLKSYDYVIKNAQSVALRISFEYSAYLFKNEKVSYITDISASGEKSNLNLPQLTLYFAKKNENVWDIAKKFSTDARLIMEENNLSSQIIECQKVLLVPGM